MEKCTILSKHGKKYLITKAADNIIFHITKFRMLINVDVVISKRINVILNSPFCGIVRLARLRHGRNQGCNDVLILWYKTLIMFCYILTVVACSFLHQC